MDRDKEEKKCILRYHEVKDEPSVPLKTWNSRKANDREKREKVKETSQNAKDKLLVNTTE